MPRLTDLTRVQALLNLDREWAAYAIGDLAPGLVEHCDWHAPADGAAALVMLYRGFDPPILFAMGELAELRPLFAEVTAGSVSLHVQPAALTSMDSEYRPVTTRAMIRMTLRPGAFTPQALHDVRPVTDADLAAVAALYDDGHRRHEGPTFFHPSMLAQGSFYGVWEQDALVAIAGTHLYSPALGVCTIGNVYTRSDCRGRGLGARVTSAVARHAMDDGITTIVLNVGQANTAAQRVYERLGFVRYCDFIEGEAARTGTP